MPSNWEARPPEPTAASAVLQVANITFVQAGTANINFNHNGNMQAVTSANWTSSGQMTSATIDISSNWITTNGGYNDGRTGIYSYGFQTYIHEIGHALGLGHQGPYNATATYGTSNIYANDTWQFSVMSYFSQDNYSGSSFDFVITPQMADITAVQSIYGAASTRAGNTSYGFNSTAGSIYDFTQYTGTPAFTIYDTGGSDTLDCSGYSQNQRIDLTPGAFCSVGGFANNIGIFTTTTLETAIGGSGNDTVLGNSANNTLIGGRGNDVIEGGAGTDTAVYGGTRAQYQATRNANGSFHIVDLRGGAPDGTDDVSNVEFFQFADRTVGAGALLNLPPVVAVANHSLQVNRWSSVATWISYSDPNNDPAIQYQFLDTGTAASSAKFWSAAYGNQPAQTILTVSAADLANGNVWVGGATAAGSETMSVRAFDGTDWSEWAAFTLTTLPNHAPTISVTNHTLEINHWSSVSGWISYNDADSDPATQYQFWYGDTSPTAAKFWTPSGYQPALNYLTASVADVAAGNVWVGGGTAAGYETIWVRMSDGIDWSNWTSLTLTTGAPVQKSGDFDHDLKGDILWRHDSGQIYFWEMNGLGIKMEGAAMHAAVPTDWHIQGTGDFDGDGKSDVLWRHDSGPVYIWEMNGLGTKAEGGIAHAAVPNDWHIQAIGDFDGDLRSDLLWRHDNGQVYIWEMNGLGIKAENGVAHAAVPNDWHIQGIGDYDGDGKSDIFWRHDNGQVYVWEMNGFAVKTEGAVAHAPIPNDWHIVA